MRIIQIIPMTMDRFSALRNVFFWNSFVPLTVTRLLFYIVILYRIYVNYQWLSKKKKKIKSRVQKVKNIFFTNTHVSHFYYKYPSLVSMRILWNTTMTNYETNSNPWKLPLQTSLGTLITNSSLDNGAKLDGIWQHFCIKARKVRD